MVKSPLANYSDFKEPWSRERSLGRCHHRSARRRAAAAPIRSPVASRWA
jgi:hypothetical protein